MANTVLKTSEAFQELKIKRNFELHLNVDKVSEFSKESDKPKRRLIKGYAATTGKDRGDDDITMEALKECRDDLLKEGSNTVFFNHNRNIPIGKVVKTAIDTKGLLVEIEISQAKDVEDYWTKIKEKVLSCLSIGGKFKKVEIIRNEKGEIESFKILKLELYEVSVVGIPMNAKATIFEAVEKSFKNLKKKEIKMKEENKKELNKEVVKDAPKEVFSKEQMDYINDAIAKANEPVTKGLGDISKSVEALVNSVKTLTEKKEEPKKEEPKKEEEKSSSDSEIVKALNALTQKIDTLGGTRKGRIEPDEIDEDDEEDKSKNKSIEKCLDLEDPKSKEYVKYLMDTPAGHQEYQKLSVEEKSLAKTIWGLRR